MTSRLEQAMDSLEQALADLASAVESVPPPSAASAGDGPAGLNASDRAELQAIRTALDKAADLLNPPAGGQE